MLSQQTISEVESRIEIEEVVSDFVSLKRRGQNLVACCPFHDEKTPSFSVSPGKGIYKCFGCGKGGDAISFVMEIEGINYVEAIRYLAAKYGVEIIEDTASDEDLQKQNERDSLFIVLNFAKEYFRKLLWEHESGMTIGLSYFKERGFSHQVIKKFELGYALEQWDGLYQAARKEGYNPELLEKAGLIIKKESRTYDRFRGRVIFPIHNVSGKVIAFGARVLKQDVQPKYLNSPETDIYHKSKILYGIHQAKQAIKQFNNCYLVEGYTDVISLHLSGVEHVVASSGTSLTTDQIKLIGRYTENITVLFDGDTAGIKASLRGIDMILESGMNVRTVTFPNNEDPDSYSRKVGSGEFQRYLQENSTDFIVFKVNLYASEAANDPIRKSETIKEIVNSIAKIPEPVKRTVYIRECSSILKIDESVLLGELNKILIRQYQDKKKASAQQEPEVLVETEKASPEILLSPEDIIRLQEKESIRLLINYGFDKNYELYDYFMQELDGMEFNTPVYKDIIEIINEQAKAGVEINAEFLIKNGNEEIKKTVIDLITEKYELSENWEAKYHILVPRENERIRNAALDNILRLKLRVIRKLIGENLEELKNAPSEEEQENHQLIHAELKKSEMEIAKALGNVVIR